MDNHQFAQQLQIRLLGFSKKVILFCRKLPKDRINQNLSDQLSRSGSSIGANYIEANESLGGKDFYMRLKICRKESKETVYWLEIIEDSVPELSNEAKMLKSEADEYLRLFSSILNKLNH